MAMTIGEAEAVQDILWLVIPQIGKWRRAGVGIHDQVVVGTRTVELGKIMSEGEYLAERSAKTLGTGMGAARWGQAVASEAAIDR